MSQNYCADCAVSIPGGQRFCSICYGDMEYGKDGYYRDWYIQQLEEEENEKRENEERERSEMSEKELKPYFVVDIKNSPIPMEFDGYYVKGDYTSRVTELIDSHIDALEIGGEPVTIIVKLVELNDEQIEFIEETGGDISDFESSIEEGSDNGHL